jgi:N-acetylmuramoyl-L-alanine amidase
VLTAQSKRLQPVLQQRWLHCAVLLCCGLVFAGAIPAGAVATRSKAAKHVTELTPWELAERAREKFEAISESSRTKADYAAVLDTFRAVYHQNPQDVHAASAVYSVAELLTEQGRSLHDATSLKAAIGQYEFLRTQYPGSSLRVPALLAEGQIYGNDLNDSAAAKERYQLLLKKYPRSAQAEEAKAGLEGRSATPRVPIVTSPTATSDRAADTSVADRRGTTAAMDEPLDAAPPVGGVTASGSMVAAKSGKHHGGLAKVTGIRHWSTPDYTRVAIDLGDDVTYEAARVPNPDRIYFDLHGTRLAQELVGKSFAVTDDGFLKKIRAAQFSNDMTRVVLDVSDVTEYSAFLLPNPYRLIIDIHGGNKDPGLDADSAAAPSPRAEVPAPQAAPVVRPTQAHPVPNTVSTRSTNSTDIASLSAEPGKVDATSVPTSRPISATVDTAGVSAVVGKSTKKGKKGKADTSVGPARAAVPTADGQTSLVRALGLKIGRIVIDAGHGGHDSGTIGVDGIEEKDIVLDVALRVGKLLHDRLGAEVVYTRSDDTFIPLETRTAIANKAQADLFLSIHANSSSDSTARGVETYYLNFTSDPTALDVAARENAVSGQSIHQLSDLVKKITLKDKIAESREFASDVESSLYGGLQRGNAGLRDRGVKKAPFVVLIGANMPSILAEISFVTNQRDANQLSQPEYRQRVAESLYKGVAKYAGGLSGVRTPTERASTK